MLENLIAYEDFFRNAPELNENRKLIKGVVCGERVEEINLMNKGAFYVQQILF